MIVYQKENKEQEHLVLDLSGVCYSISKEAINNFPDALLVVLWQCHLNPRKQLPRGVFRTKQANKFFVQRSPYLFDVILQCYVTGKLHVPSWVCRKTILDEIIFWKLGPQHACDCCADEDNEEEERQKEIRRESLAHKSGGRWPRTKWAMWRFFHEPQSSRGALIFAIVAMSFVLISILNLVLASIPTFHLCPTNATEIYSSSQVDKIKNSLETDFSDFNDTLPETNLSVPFKPEGVLRLFSNCLGMQKFEMVDMICIGWFTIELTLRFVACPSKAKFVKSPLNIIDFTASFPLYVELFLWMCELSSSALSYHINLTFRILRTVTVLRVLKLARYSSHLRILGKTIKSAKNELAMLCLFVAVSTLIYSSVVYQLEHEEPETLFTSIPASMWWSIVTLTTVGFGDIVPRTVAGKIVGAIGCVTGIMIVALPVSVLVEHFNEAYKKRSKAAFPKAVAPRRK